MLKEIQQQRKLPVCYLFLCEPVCRKEWIIKDGILCGTFLHRHLVKLGDLLSMLNLHWQLVAGTEQMVSHGAWPHTDRGFLTERGKSSLPLLCYVFHAQKTEHSPAFNINKPPQSCNWIKSTVAFWFAIIFCLKWQPFMFKLPCIRQVAESLFYTYIWMVHLPEIHIREHLADNISYFTTTIDSRWLSWRGEGRGVRS